MNCPACSAPLQRTKYEGLPVFHCGKCDGYLVASRRMDGIQRRREKSPQELQEEVPMEPQDSEHTLRCPRCRRYMEKETHGSIVKLQLDKCKDCQWVWFDVGELALVQLEYEASPQGKDAAALQDRHQQMTPEERAEFEADLAALPEGEASLASAFGQGLLGSFRNLSRNRHFD